MTLPIAGDGTALSGHVVAVDIGGTKTQVAVAPVEAAGSWRTREFVVPSVSWRGALGDFRADGVALRDLLVGHLGESVLSAPLAVGAHGCDNTDQCHELEHVLRRLFTGPVVVVNDSELMAPAMGVDGAIGVVVGTGSIATARDGGGELLTAGGWGWLLGDEGSAPALVRDATRAVLAHLDRGEAIDVLGQRLLAAFAARDGVELALAVTRVASAGAWGVHAPEVFAAADEGSVIAADIIRNAGEELAGLVDRLLARGVRTNAVVAGGSVIERQPRLQNALRSALVRHHVDVKLHILSRSPVMGAVALARGIAGEATNNP
ncbi:BadF/BadG/BcrA/BcrD ATPase family protein [Agromyces sp. H3Y2-19a]|uniref:N-acetylglucosamine kinase n=1 Tax=Agromyces TaxID=33877 RepID=UPI0023B91DC0|nr:BadF/BadG/BcrA/BcrD ATPase family protein [Agromyces chromiiresistens]MDF0513158.1 BadF/BadG/BcrA/BcrD ATPase family protein [Agromyces chromiiresistens]